MSDQSFDILFHSELLQSVPDWYYQELKHKLENDPKYADRRAEFVFNDEDKSIVQLFVKFNRSEVAGLTDEQISYYPLCNLEEIALLSDPADAEDYLLKLRADEVNNDMRTTRVFYRLREFYGKQWNFTEYFGSKLFGRYTFLLNPELEMQCDQVPAGFINYPDANGCCVKTPFGNIILISYALKYFLYYGTLWAIAGSLDISEQDAFDALIIAVRTMLGHESMDFEIEPRADLPGEIHRRVQLLTDQQLMFIIGHEYAHHYLGHLDDTSLVKLHAVASDLKLYNYSQQKELDADFYAIHNLDMDIEDKAPYLEAAMTFFCIMDVYQCFKDALDPWVGNYRSHPKPVDRLWELRRKFPETIGYTTGDLKSLLERNEQLKNFLVNEFIGIYTDELEMYGSNYIQSYIKERPLDRLDFSKFPL